MGGEGDSLAGDSLTAFEKWALNKGMWHPEKNLRHGAIYVERISTFV